MRFRITIVILLALFASAVVAQDPPPPVKEYNPNAWKEFTSDEGRFTVSVPGTPRQRNSTLETPLGPITTYAFLLETEMALYYMSYADFPQVGPMTPQDQKEALDSSRDRAIADGARLISESDVLVAGNIGRELLVDKNGVILRSRFFHVNGRLYQLILGVKPTTAFSNGKPSAKPADRTAIFEQTSTKFFDSFKLKK